MKESPQVQRVLKRIVDTFKYPRAQQSLESLLDQIDTEARKEALAAMFMYLCWCDYTKGKK